ncbi:MAG: DNA cytosine methyltransferase, partial [Dolichospermum sp.]
YFLCPIKDLIKKQLPDELYQLDILDGSPPCSTFSMAGSRERAWGKKKHFREGQTKQVLDDLFFDYLDLVEKLKPKVAIAENVKGLILGNAKGYCKMIVDRFKEIGYSPQLFLINAADCGVPQRRKRVFFIALRNDIYKPKLILKPNKKWVTAGEATNDIQDLTDDEIRDTAPTFQDLKCWQHTTKGDDYSVFLEKTENRTSNFNRIRINDSAPSATLTSYGHNFTHWNICRRLTYREYKRLGSFPDDYQAKTDRIGKYIIGMSVPPKMMYAVVKSVIEQWF